MIRERTRAGLDAARSQGRFGGRPQKLTDNQVDEVRKMVLLGRKSAADAARLFGVHPSTISRLLAYADPPATKPQRRRESGVSQRVQKTSRKRGVKITFSRKNKAI